MGKRKKKKREPSIDEEAERNALFEGVGKKTEEVAPKVDLSAAIEKEPASPIEQPTEAVTVEAPILESPELASNVDPIAPISDDVVAAPAIEEEAPPAYDPSKDIPKVEEEIEE